jgi:hypothetical protein
VRGCGTEQFVSTNVVQGEAVDDDDRKPEPTPITETRPGATAIAGATVPSVTGPTRSSTVVLMKNLMYVKCMCMYNKIRIFCVVFMSY